MTKDRKNDMEYIEQQILFVMLVFETKYSAKQRSLIDWKFSPPDRASEFLYPQPGSSPYGGEIYFNPSFLTEKSKS